MGLLLYQRGRYSDALRELEAAKAALARPEFDYNIGLCLAKLDRPEEAADALERFVTARPDDPEAPSIRTRILELRRQVKPPPPEIDHPPLPPVATTPAPPPPPAAAPGAEPVPPGVSALPDKNAPRPESGFARFARSPQGIATFAVGGVTVVSLLTAAITGGVALSDKSTYNDSCNLGLCDHGEWQSAHSLGIATDVLIAVGVAGAVTTTVLALVRPRTRALAAAPGGLVLRW